MELIQWMSFPQVKFGYFQSAEGEYPRRLEADFAH